MRKCPHFYLLFGAECFSSSNMRCNKRQTDLAEV